MLKIRHIAKLSNDVMGKCYNNNLKMKLKKTKTKSKYQWSKLRALITGILFWPLIIFSQNLTSSTNINIIKTWPQQPGGYTYPININIIVPTGAVPQGDSPYVYYFMAMEVMV